MKLKKKALRSAQRGEAGRRRETLLNDIMCASHTDSRKMFTLISKAKGVSSDMTDLLCVDGSVYTGPDEVREGWAVHFSNLATAAEPENPTWYDQLVACDYLLLLHYSLLDTRHIQTNLLEVQEAIVSLKKGKACDVCGITAGHFIYAPEELVGILTDLINAIFAKRLLPNFLKVGMMSSVFKKKHPITNPCHHRGITVIIIVSKVIEAVLRNHSNPIFTPSQHPLQRGFSKGVSPLYAAWILQEVMNEKADKKEPLYMAFLDAKVAFDTV